MKREHDLKFQKATVIGSSKLPDFKLLLDEWLKVQQRYCERVWPENPWVYSERPCVGLLAAAATLVGAVVLEEWRTEKSREKGEGYGRNDLWLRFNKKTDYAIEAKHTWINVHNGFEAIITPAINDTLASALKDASNTPDYAGSRVGIAFFSLQHRDPQTVSHVTSRLFKMVESEIKSDAFAGICLSSESFAKAKQNGWKHDEFGMILLAKLVAK